MGSGVLVMGWNKGRTEHGQCRDGEVGSGVFVGVLHKDMSQPCSFAEREMRALECFLGD